MSLLCLKSLFVKTFKTNLHYLRIQDTFNLLSASEYNLSWISEGYPSVINSLDVFNLRHHLWKYSNETIAQNFYYYHHTKEKEWRNTQSVLLYNVKGQSAMLHSIAHVQKNVNEYYFRLYNYTLSTMLTYTH